MSLNRNLLMAYNLRAIHISDFLEKLKPLEGKSGEERKKLQDQIAEEIVKNYPLRKKEHQEE